MKKIVISLIALAITTSTFAQDAATTTPQIPEFKNTPMGLKPDGSLAKLEKPQQETKTKQKGFSFGARMVTFLNILGAASPVNIPASKAKFIIKLQDEETDPEGIVYFTKVSVSKESREVTLSEGAVAIAAGFGGKGKSVQSDDIKADFTKVQPGVYSFVPASPLEGATQYAILLDRRNSNQGVAAYCFATK